MADPLTTALWESDPGLQRSAGNPVLAPRYTIRCSECADLLATVYMTSVGGLLRQERPRARIEVTNNQTGDTRLERRGQRTAGFLDDLPDDFELRCSRRDGWRPAPRETLLRLLNDTPSDRVVAI